MMEQWNVASPPGATLISFVAVSSMIKYLAQLGFLCNRSGPGNIENPRLAEGDLFLNCWHGSENIIRPSSAFDSHYSMGYLTATTTPFGRSQILALWAGNHYSTYVICFIQVI